MKIISLIYCYNVLFTRKLNPKSTENVDSNSQKFLLFFFNCSSGEYNFGHSTVNPRRLRMPQIKGKPNLENLKVFQSTKQKLICRKESFFY